LIADGVLDTAGRLRAWLGPRDHPDQLRAAEQPGAVDLNDQAEDVLPSRKIEPGSVKASVPVAMVLSAAGAS
jgi:hypothetical protein